jgi:hypothetical protein
LEMVSGLAQTVVIARRARRRSSCGRRPMPPEEILGLVAEARTNWRGIASLAGELVLLCWWRETRERRRERGTGETECALLGGPGAAGAP